MSEHLTHIAVYEDAASFVLHTDRFCNAFRQCIEEHYDSGLVTSGTRGNHIFAVPILEKYKDNWDEASISKEAKMQVAGSIGWLTHRAADLEMKPTWRARKEADPAFNDSEMQIYHDAVVVHKVYSGGQVSTRSPYEVITPHILEKAMSSHPASTYLHTSKVEELITLLYQKEFVELHQFHKNGPDVDQWMNDFVEYHQEFTEDLRLYMEAFTRPDPEKMESYVHSINFYDENDPLIRWARGIRANQDISEIDLDDALVQAEGQSHYSKALLKAYRFLSDASSYFENELEKNALYDTLGMPENQRP